MRRIITRNGLGGPGSNPRFFIFPDIQVMFEEITPTTPRMFFLELEIDFYIADYKEKTILSSINLEKNGGGTTKDLAFKDAIKKIKTSNSDMSEFVSSAKNKIIQYYNDKCDITLSKVDALVSQNKYHEALFELANIPEVCKDCYTKAMEKAEPVYQKYIDHQCTEYLTEAKTIWAANQNYAGASEAGKWLSWIEPGAACYDDAMRFVETIKKKVLADENRQWDFVMKRYDADDNIEQQRIRAIRDIGVAYGEGQPDVNYNLKEIFR